jgi:hypothetical protein
MCFKYYESSGSSMDLLKDVDEFTYADTKIKMEKKKEKMSGMIKRKFRVNK